MVTVAFGESTISRTQVQVSYNRFKEVREDFIYDACPGRQSTSTTDKNIEAVKKRERFLRMLAYRSALAKQFLRIF